MCVHTEGDTVPIVISWFRQDAPQVYLDHPVCARALLFITPCGGVDWPKCFQLSSEMMEAFVEWDSPCLWPVLNDTMSLSLACGCSWGQARLTIPCNKKSNTSPPLPASGILLILFTSLPLLPIYAISLFRHRAKPPLFPPPIISTAPNS